MIVRAGLWLVAAALTAQAPTSESARHEVTADAAPADPPLAELRKAAASAFFGARSFDETSRLTIAELLPEHSFEAACTGAQTVRDAALKAFQRGGFEEVDVRVKYPGLALYLVRRMDRQPLIHILLFYFKVERAPGLNCRFTFGQYARVEDEPRRQVLEGVERDSLYREIKQTWSGLESALRSGTAR